MKRSELLVAVGALVLAGVFVHRCHQPAAEAAALAEDVSVRGRLASPTIGPHRVDAIRLQALLRRAEAQDRQPVLPSSHRHRLLVAALDTPAPEPF